MPCVFKHFVQAEATGFITLTEASVFLIQTEASGFLILTEASGQNPHPNSKASTVLKA